MSLPKNLMLLCLVLMGCAKPAAVPVAVQEKSEEEKLQRRKEMTALYDEWKIENIRYESLLRQAKDVPLLNDRGERRSYQEIEAEKDRIMAEAKARSEKSAALEKRCKDQYGVGPRELPSIYPR